MLHPPWNSFRKGTYFILQKLIKLPFFDVLLSSRGWTYTLSASASHMLGRHPHTCVEVPQLPWVYSLESLEFLAGQSTGRAASEWNSSRQV